MNPIFIIFLSLVAFLSGNALAQDEHQSIDPGIFIKTRINQYDHQQHNLLIYRQQFPSEGDHLKARNSEWQVSTKVQPVTDRKDAKDYTITLRCTAGSIQQASVSVDIEINRWSRQNYVLMPGAVYNGNRYDYRRIRYSPKLLDPRDIGPDQPIILSDVPKLAHDDGFSRIQQRTGDMTTPGIGYHDQANSKGFFLLTDQATGLGDTGISITESRDRQSATISLTAPVMRELYKYRITDNRWPSDDQPVDFSAGDEVTLHFRLYSFEAHQLQDLFDRFAVIRKDVIDNGKRRKIIPFSDCFRVQEQKFNQLNWESKHGYYSVGPRNMFLQDWQIGWTGGMISTYPLLWAGNEQTRQNVIRNFDWLFPDGIAPSGLFWDSGEHGDKWYGGDIRKPHTKNWHLIRKSGDGLFYIVKQLMLMEEMQMEVKESWKNGTKGASDALVKIWQDHGQFGQFVDNPTGEVVVGGSTSGGIIPAALCLAYQYFDRKDYLKTAQQAGEYYYQNFVKKGITNGGPGDAMQNFDSESCYALVESYATLYETTGDNKWLKYGSDVARQFSTWVISYNYQFPPGSLFGKLDMYSLGAVNANTQNKHGAPGICTHSGLGLLKLYRATGDTFYLDLLQDISHNLPQYLSHPDRPIAGANLGWMCERVNTTDWLEGIGEITYLTTWAETSLMLTYIEIPGIYVQTDKNYIKVFDNVDAEIKRKTRNRMVLSVTNPTRMTAKVKLVQENEEQMKQPFGQNALLKAREIILKPGETREVILKI
ncbi:MAG: hypothetical protein ACNS62_17675 [Candidatus Cyclobacteriaceae bacterium M3_2C_046]